MSKKKNLFNEESLRLADIRTGGAGGGGGLLRTGLPATGHGLHRQPPHFGGVRSNCFCMDVFFFMDDYFSNLHTSGG